MPHLIEGPVQGHITEDRKKKNLSTGGSRTHALSVMRGALYLCATTAANYFTVLQCETCPRGCATHIRIPSLRRDLLEQVEAIAVVGQHQQQQQQQHQQQREVQGLHVQYQDQVEHQFQTQGWSTWAAL